LEYYYERLIDGSVYFVLNVSIEKKIEK